MIRRSAEHCGTLQALYVTPETHRSLVGGHCRIWFAQQSLHDLHTTYACRPLPSMGGVWSTGVAIHYGTLVYRCRGDEAVSLQPAGLAARLIRDGTSMFL